MEKIDVVFCVLTYKNHVDLVEFIDSLKNDNIKFLYKIIVVNSFADEGSLNMIKEIAISNSCDFIESENKGYGYGNNIGISFAKENYIFDYLVVSNPDTIIKQFSIESLRGQEKSIIAPEIVCLNGKRQNPLNYRYMPISEKLMYIAFKNRNKMFLYMGIGLNKINRYINNLLTDIMKQNRMQVYACHGSFIIFSHFAIEKLSTVFDDNIFLFCEEGDLAKSAQKLNINIELNKDIAIQHKEDGSMNLSNNNLNEILRKSYLYYYKKWNGV